MTNCSPKYGMSMVFLFLLHSGITQYIIKMIIYSCISVDYGESLLGYQCTLILGLAPNSLCSLTLLFYRKFAANHQPVRKMFGIKQALVRLKHVC